MIVIVNGEERELECRINGIDCSHDLVGNTADLKVNEEGIAIMSENDFEWWKEYLTNLKNDTEEINELCNEYPEHAEMIRSRIADEAANDMEDEHDVKQSILEEIKKELN